MTLLERVRHDLAAHRAAGAPFDLAWPAALQRADVDDWLTVLDETRDAWAAAYDRAPLTRPQRALVAVAADPLGDREPFNAPDPWERACLVCGQAIPAERRSVAVYCSPVCQRSAHGRRVAA